MFTVALLAGLVGTAVALAGEWLAIRIGTRLRDARVRRDDSRY